MAKTGFPYLRTAAALLVTAPLAACGTSQQMSSLLVAPGKYDIYTCPQIADRMQEVAAEGQNLEALMARASKDASGQFVSNIAYEPDYLVNRGEMRELQKSAIAKNCTNLPAAAVPTGRASDKTIR
jgi:hypothetical protein